MLKINKSFIRKITINTVAYLVEQNKETQVMQMTIKKLGVCIYKYDSHTNVATYDEKLLGIIELVFSTANIDRYVV